MNRHSKAFAIVTICVFVGLTNGNHMANRTTNQGSASATRGANPRLIGSASPTRGANPRLIGFLVPQADGTTRLQLISGARQMIGPGRRIATAPLSRLQNLAAAADRNPGSNTFSIRNILNAARRANILPQETPASSAEPGRTPNIISVKPPQHANFSSSTVENVQSLVVNRTKLNSPSISKGSVARSSSEIINLLEKNGPAAIQGRQLNIPIQGGATTLVNGISLAGGINNSGVSRPAGVAMNVDTLDSGVGERVVVSGMAETGKGKMESVVGSTVTGIRSSFNVSKPGVSTLGVQTTGGVVDSDTLKNSKNLGPQFDVQGGLDNVDIRLRPVLDNQSRTQTAHSMFRSAASNQNIGPEAIPSPAGAPTVANSSGMSNMVTVNSIFMNVNDAIQPPHLDVRLDATNTLHGIAKATDQFANILVPVQPLPLANAPQFDRSENTRNTSSNVSFDGGVTVEGNVPVAQLWVPAERGIISEAAGTEPRKIIVSNITSMQPSKVPVIDTSVNTDIAGAETRTVQSADFVRAGTKDVASNELVNPGTVESSVSLSVNNSGFTGESGQPVISAFMSSVLPSIPDREIPVLGGQEIQSTMVAENAVFEDSVSAVQKRLRTLVQNVLDGVMNNAQSFARDTSSSTVGDQASPVRMQSTVIQNQEVGTSGRRTGLTIFEQNLHRAIQNITSGARENPDLVYTDKKTLRRVIEDVLREMLSILMTKSSTGATASARDTTKAFNKARVPFMKVQQEKVRKAETDFLTNTTSDVSSINTGADVSLTAAEINISGSATDITVSPDSKGITGIINLDSKGSMTLVKETTGEQALNYSLEVDTTTVKSSAELETKIFSSSVNVSVTGEESQSGPGIPNISFATENFKPIVMTTDMPRPLVSPRDDVNIIIGDWTGTSNDVTPPLKMLNSVNNGGILRTPPPQLPMMANQAQPFITLTPSLSSSFLSTPSVAMNGRNRDRQPSQPPISTPATAVGNNANSISSESPTSVSSSSFRIQTGNTRVTDTNASHDRSNIQRTEKIIVELSSLSNNMENITTPGRLDTKYNNTIEGMIKVLYNSSSFAPGSFTMPKTSSRGENVGSAISPFIKPGASAPYLFSYSTQNTNSTSVQGPKNASGQDSMAQNGKSQSILHINTIPSDQSSSSASNTSSNPTIDLTTKNASSYISLSAPSEYNLTTPNDTNLVIAENQTITALNESIYIYDSLSTQPDKSSLQLENDTSTALNNIEAIGNSTFDPVASSSMNATAQTNSTGTSAFSSSPIDMTTPEATTVSTIPTPTTPDPDTLAERRELQRVANMFISPTDPEASELKAEAAEAREALL